MEILPESTSNSSAVGSVDGVTTSFQLSQNSRPSCSIIKDKYMMKAQYMLMGKLLASFQDLEHEGGDTRSQGGIRFKDNDKKIKIQDHKHENGSSKGILKNTRLQVSRCPKKDAQLNDHPLGGVMEMIRLSITTCISKYLTCLRMRDDYQKPSGLLVQLKNTPLYTRNYRHGFYHKDTKDNKQLRHDLGNHDHQKNYAGARCEPLEIQVGSKVRLKVSHREGLIRFNKWENLKPGYIGTFKIISKVGTVTIRFKIPKQLSRVHSTFHVSNLKKCLANERLVILLDEIQIDDKLHFIEKTIEIIDRKVKCLKQSRILIVKVR
nr:putative reverse transcriptase domain-containing protein [Tanacetum cinerariifolium]